MNKKGKEMLPTSKEQCFGILDGMLSENDRKVIANSEEMMDLHFGLGMWIRNNWIYGMDEKVTDLFLPGMGFMPDMASDMILSEYQQYLKEKHNKLNSITMEEKRILVKAKARICSWHLAKCEKNEPYTKTYRREFFKAFKDVPECEVMNEFTMVADDKLIMEVISGERKVVVLKRDNDSAKALVNRNIAKYRNAMKSAIHSSRDESFDVDEKVLLLEDGIKHFVGEDKEVCRLTIRNAENTLSVTAEVRENDHVELCKEQVKNFRRWYGSRELDTRLKKGETDENMMTAVYFYFVLGDVVEAYSMTDGAVEVTHVREIPQTREEFYAIIDSLLTDEQQRDYFAHSDHLRKDKKLRQWIANNWIYGMKGELVDLLEDVYDSRFWGSTLKMVPETVVDLALDCYLDHLYVKLGKPSLEAEMLISRLMYGLEESDVIETGTCTKLYRFTKEEWLGRRMRVLARYSDFPEAGVLPVLDYVVDTDVAKDLAEGKIPVWWDYDKDDKLYKAVKNKDTERYINEHDEDKDYGFNEWIGLGNGFFPRSRMVQTVHFHDKENTWFVDVECLHNQLTVVSFGDWDNTDDVEAYQRKYGTDYLKKAKKEFLDAMDRYLADESDDAVVPELPYMYFLVLGKVVGTNVK